MYPQSQLRADAELTKPHLGQFLVAIFDAFLIFGEVVISFNVIPAKAGILCYQVVLDSRLRGNDLFGTLYDSIKI